MCVYIYIYIVCIFRLFLADFARKARLKKKKFISLVSLNSEEEWEMELREAPDGRISMGRGWLRLRWFKVLQ